MIKQALHDRYQVYDHPSLGPLTHQLCCAHLLRDLQDAAETYSGAAWPAQIAAAIRHLIGAAAQARDQHLDAVPAATAGPSGSCWPAPAWRSPITGPRTSPASTTP